MLMRRAKNCVWGSKLFKIINVDKPKKSSSLVLVVISSISVPIYNYFYARRAYNGKIRSFREVLRFRVFVQGNPLMQRH